MMAMMPTLYTRCAHQSRICSQRRESTVTHDDLRRIHMSKMPALIGIASASRRF